MKRFLTLMLVLICLAACNLNQGNCACPQNQDEDQLIFDLEKNIAEQEKLLGVLRARYAKLLSRKKQLLEWIEQEKEKLRQQEESLSRQKVPVKLPPEKISSERKAEPEIRAVRSQPDLAGEKSGKLQESQDIKRLDFLIKRQKKLSAEIIKLEIKIAAEENKIKTLKESLRTLKNL